MTPPRKAPRHNLDRHKVTAKAAGYTVHEHEPLDDGRILVDVRGYDTLITFYYRQSASGFWRFHHASVHVGGRRVYIRPWRQTLRTLYAIRDAWRALNKP